MPAGCVLGPWSWDAQLDSNTHLTIIRLPSIRENQGEWGKCSFVLPPPPQILPQSVEKQQQGSMRGSLQAFLSPALWSEEGGLNNCIHHRLSVRPAVRSCLHGWPLFLRLTYFTKKHHYINKVGDSRAMRTLLDSGSVLLNQHMNGCIRTYVNHSRTVAERIKP